MLEPTDSITSIASAHYDLIERDKAELGIKQVFYGDQKKVSDDRVVCIEPALMDSAFAGQGASNRTTNVFQIYHLVYIQRVDTVDEITKEGDLLAEAIRTKLHEDTKFGGLVVSSFVTRIEFGYTPRANKSWFRSARITWQGMNKTYINTPGV